MSKEEWIREVSESRKIVSQEYYMGTEVQEYLKEAAVLMYDKCEGERVMQNELMKYDPATGECDPYPSHSEQWRKYHGKDTAWLFNPWTGERRVATDVGSDIQGYLIGEPQQVVPLQMGTKTQQG